MGRLSKTQKEKRDFRASKVWKEFRHKKNVEQHGLDPITLRKLYKGANLHHLDLDEKHYKDLSNESHFVMLNKQTHDAVHWLYKYYIKDENVLFRLKMLLDEMKAINGDKNE